MNKLKTILAVSSGVLIVIALAAAICFNYLLERELLRQIQNNQRLIQVLQVVLERLK